VLLADKPAGVTSHDVVAAVRRAHPGVKVGHAGTLDPFATGLLIVLIGDATRLQARFMGLEKEYEALACLGAVSSTGDPKGALTHTGVLPSHGQPLPTGHVVQRPPTHSAVHIDGQRAYERARRGEVFEVPERTVVVHEFREVWRRDDPERGEGTACYHIRCSSGTYVRSLIADLGDAYCQGLRRTAIGPFRVEDAAQPPLPLDADLSWARRDAPQDEALALLGPSDQA
jgi:tRNA pseudouridine55 synthase